MEQVLPTMPDICIVYKLHLESRFDQINMYDWLQVSFNCDVYCDYLLNLKQFSDILKYLLN